MFKAVFYTVAGRNFAYFFTFFILIPTIAQGQASPGFEGDTSSRVVVASDRYQKNSFYQWLWGRHYRDVWSTPVRVPVLDLETAGGGLTPVRRGGGWQTRTLHLKGKDGHDYVLRSIDKYYGQAMPELYKGTFIETLATDQASTGFPYGAFTIPGMISAAGIYHTKPQLVIIPDHPVLDSFRGTFGNMLALFEERADDDQSHAPHFGRSSNVVGTEKMLENITESHKHKVDQLAYIKARIFDMFIGDWGRHEDQWRWATFKENGLTIYRPIPRDRDQVYSKFDGVLLKIALGAAQLKHLQSFDHTIKNVAKYNYPARHLDRRVANEPTREQWIAMAAEIQAAMTDEVIRNSVKQMPQEAFQKSGEDIIAKLISRRNSLKEFAEAYYEFLAEEVEIVGSDITETFIINQAGQDSLLISVANTDGSAPLKEYFGRKFYSGETKEVRLYGLSGDDQFVLAGNHSGIKVRIIGGEGNDIIRNESITRTRQVDVYDTKELSGSGLNGVKTHIGNDTLRNNYRYNWFNYDKSGFKIKPGTTVGIGYMVRKQKWGKKPFGYEHSLMFEWTFTRGGLAVVYRGQFNEVIGKWGLAPIARYDFPYVDHFFGIGNETRRLTEETKNSFYRVHTTEILAGLGFNRRIDSHFIQLQPYYQSIELDVQDGKFLDLFDGGVPLADRGKKTFGGVELVYRFQQRNDPLTPTKGIGFNLSGNYIQNYTDDDRDITKYGGALWGYIPLFRNTTLALRVGGATLDGNPIFYQMNTLGGNVNLRGYARRRFFGTTAGYNNNEIRWLANTRNRLFNGQIGLLAFFDQGRIWQKGQSSDKWHYGYGGGLVIVPFKKAVLNGTVGFGDEKPVVHARIGFLF